ncbi:hypothetical protein ACO1K0_14180, partial [Staphylococcus aureus]
FFLAIAMFGFVFQISSLITEKELKLRQAMTNASSARVYALVWNVFHELQRGLSSSTKLA